MWSAPACHAPWLLLVNSVADFAPGRQEEGSRFFRLKAAARPELVQQCSRLLHKIGMTPEQLGKLF
jgi:hypothetical protein